MARIDSMLHRRLRLAAGLAAAITACPLAPPGRADLLPTGPPREADTSSQASDGALAAMTPAGEVVFLVSTEGTLKAITYDGDDVQKGPVVELGVLPVPVGSSNAFFPDDFAVDPSGNLIVVGDNQHAVFNSDVYGQRFASDGTALGTAFQVNSYTTPVPQTRPVLTVLDDGGFVVTWVRRTVGVIRHDIAAQRFDAQGDPFGTEFVANQSGSINSLPRPDVAPAPGGGFLVVWDRNHVEGRLFDATTTPVGNDFQIGASHPISSFSGEGASVARGGDAFVVAWRSATGSAGIVAQRVDSSGGAIGTEFVVSSASQVNPVYAKAAAAPDGSFVVAWNGTSPAQSGRFPVARRYDSSGNAVGAEFVVAEEPANIFTSYGTAVDMDDAGNMVVSWLRRRDDSDLAPFSQYMRRYCNSEADADADTIDDCADVCAGFDDTVDIDGDGIPDACDACQSLDSGQTIDVKPRLSFRNVGVDVKAVNDFVVAGGGFRLAGAMVFGDLAPQADGMRLVLHDGAGRRLSDFDLPSGAAWTVSGNGRKWRYRDDAGSANGIRKLQIVDRANKGPGRVDLKLKSRRNGDTGTYPVAVGDEPVNLTLVLGGASATLDGRCGQTAFAPGDCLFGSGGAGLRCR